MSIAFVAQGTYSAGSTEVTPAYPAGADAGVIAVAVVDSGHPTAAIVPSTPDGWTRVDTFEGGGGVYGADDGPRTVTIFVRELQTDDDDEPTFTITTGTQSRVGASITLLSKGATEVIRYAVSHGEDTGAGTSFSVSGAAVSWAVGDFVVIGFVAAKEAATWSAEAIAATGITFSAITERLDAQSGVGNNATVAVATGSVTAGTGTQAPTLSATLSSSSIGVASVLRMRPVTKDTGPATITLTYDDTLSSVQIAPAGLDSNATKLTVERSTDGILWTTVRGSIDAAVSGGALVEALYDYEFSPGVSNTYRVTAYNDGYLVTDVETDTITPVITQIWLKSLAHPFLNRPITALIPSDGIRIRRPPRTGVFNAKGRTLPVAVNDIRGSRQWTFLALTETIEDAVTMDYVLAAGDVMLIQAPPNCASLPTGYVTIGDYEENYQALRVARRTFTLPCVEVAPPGPYVVPVLSTWNTVIATYGGWDAVIAANLTWTDLLSLVGDPSEVIVP